VVYSLEYLEAQRAKLPQHPPTVPQFPAFDGDPLVPLYELAMEFARDGRQSRRWDRKPKAFEAGRRLLSHQPRHDSFLAAMRALVWVRPVSEWCTDNTPELSWGLACCHLSELVDALGRGDSRLSENEVDELLGLAPLSWGTGGSEIPARAVINALSFAAARQPLPDSAYPILQKMLTTSLAGGRAEITATYRKTVRLIASRPSAACTASETPSPDTRSEGKRLFDEFFGAYLDGVRPEGPVAKTQPPRDYSKVILAAPTTVQAIVLCEATERLAWWGSHNPQWPSAASWNKHHVNQFFSEIRALALTLLAKDPRLPREDLHATIGQLAEVSLSPLFSLLSLIDGYCRMIHRALPRPLDNALHHNLRRIQTNLQELGKIIPSLEALLSEPRPFPIENGDVWADRAITMLRALDHDAAQKWSALINHARSGSGSAPSAKWLKLAREHAAAAGADKLRNALIEWFPLADKPRPSLEGLPHWRRHELLMTDDNLDALKGLCWFATILPDKDGSLSRALGRLAISAYRKVPGVGPRAVKVGNAAVFALGQIPGMDSLGQLAMLRVKVKFGTAQKGIEKALNAAAARENLPRDQIDELGVPSYGLTEVGRRAEQLGDFTVELIASGIADTELRFTKADGKRIKSVPAALKEGHADELKELKSAAKDIAAMLPAQKDRLDSLFLDNKLWPLTTWRERYLEHPLIGVLARRLIWNFGEEKDPKGWKSAAWLDAHDNTPASLVDHTGAPFDPPADCSVRLWHPIESPGGRDEVLAWRRFFEDRQIRQPFKQAHREVYLLTDAERNTNTYSNRFAAHIIKQHQFNALCGIRNWKNKLRLMVDAEYPPASRALRPWGLRAEFWIEGIGDDYGVDTTESGSYHHLATDQVRFYPLDADQATAHAGGDGYGAGWRQETLGQGIALDEIPPLVLSEILRDVDLFVGVCSITNNPEWQDGGPQGTHREYWWGRSFGDISETGIGRKDLLQCLLPRLKIAAQCSLTDKFLIVKGSVRTYKIHLGSGNILMEPNDQYLCIVPSSRDASSASATGVFLPFEGDRTLSIILSKAVLLAADDKITDSTITSQIGKRA